MEKKRITISKKGEVHFGIKTLSGFTYGDKIDVNNVLKDLKGIKLWRCNVCNDLHIGKVAPKKCPTCETPDAYVEVDEKEFRKVLEAQGE